MGGNNNAPFLWKKIERYLTKEFEFKFLLTFLANFLALTLYTSLAELFFLEAKYRFEPTEILRALIPMHFYYYFLSKVIANAYGIIVFALLFLRHYHNPTSHRSFFAALYISHISGSISTGRTTVLFL